MVLADGPGATCRQECKVNYPRCVTLLLCYMWHLPARFGLGSSEFICGWFIRGLPKSSGLFSPRAASSYYLFLKMIISSACLNSISKASKTTSRPIIISLYLSSWIQATGALVIVLLFIFRMVYICDWFIVYLQNGIYLWLVCSSSPQRSARPRSFSPSAVCASPLFPRRSTTTIPPEKYTLFVVKLNQLN